MPNVRGILSELEKLAPARFAFPYDKVGLQIGDPDAQVEKAVVSFDPSIAAAEFAASQSAQFLLSHHPLIWEPLKSITPDSHAAKTAMVLLRNGIAFAAAHTNWDAAMGGINDTLAAKLGLTEVQSFGEAASVGQLKLVAFAPADSAQKVIDAASEAGAGMIGLYRRCAFYHAGTGTFFGAEAAKPAVGQAGKLEEVEEMRVEMVLPAAARERVEEGVREAHPYEEPAIDFFQLADFAEQPIGRIGLLSPQLSLADFGELVDHSLDTRSWIWGDANRRISRVAVCGGAADDEWRAAAECGVDVLVTGEVKQHVALEVCESDFSIIAAGHYATENPGSVALRDAMAARLPEIEWLMFEPQPGFAGRPLEREQ